MSTKQETKHAIIFVEAIRDYIEVTGACAIEVDGKDYIRLICRTLSTGGEILMNPVDLPVYFGRSGCAVPF